MITFKITRKAREHRSFQAFAWFSDLLADHSEIFWSLYSVDLDAALEVQPADSWDAFPLFQLLNDFLCSESSLKLGTFHKKLVEQFSPMVVRYVDLMEHSIAQSIEKGFSKEKWEQRKDGCATSEDIYWKLDALHGFIHDLNWPEEEFAKYLTQRMKSLASDMITKTAEWYVLTSTKFIFIFSTWTAFDNLMQRSKKTTDYILQAEACVMINVVFSSRSRATKLSAFVESNAVSFLYLIKSLFTVPFKTGRDSRSYDEGHGNGSFGKIQDYLGVCPFKTSAL